MEKLFEKINIGAMELKNRFVWAPMLTNRATEDGAVTQRLIDFYVRIAQGGVGLVVVEAVEIEPQPGGPAQKGLTLLNVSDDSCIPGLSALVRAIKANGAKASLQLFHSGRHAHSSAFGAYPVAPSAIAAPGYAVPHVLTIEEIGLLVERFAQAARRTKDAGFDAVELHGAHGHLIGQFLSPAFNTRNDRYGGDTRRRTTFLLEMIAATRGKVGPDFPIFVRLNGEDHIDRGLTIEETKVIARLVEEAGIDAISISAGVVPMSSEWMVQPMLMPRGCLVPMSAEIKKVVHVPVMVAGRINSPKLAETILKEGKADLIGMCRVLLADPDLPKKAQEGRDGEITKCIACNSCTGGPALSVRCILNPDWENEGQPEAKAPTARNVVILGAGPAGLEAARVARLRGHQVTVWDENKNLGGRWSWMIKPYINEQVKTLKAMGVGLEFGNSFDPDRVAQMRPDAVIVTVRGTRLIPEIPGIDQGNVLHADDVLDEKVRVEESVVVLGAGNIGCEAAEFLCRRGVKATIIESTETIAYGLDGSNGKVMTERLRQRGVEFFTRSEVLRIEGDKVYFKDAKGQERRIQADNVILALGSKPDKTFVDQLKGRGFDLYAVNYCQRPVDAYSSILEGASVARKI